MAANKATPNVYQLLPAILCLDPNFGVDCEFQGCMIASDETFAEKAIGSAPVLYTPDEPI
jgi:hypothetical protein